MAKGPETLRALQRHEISFQTDWNGLLERQDIRRSVIMKK
jgi:hypothetical protein